MLIFHHMKASVNVNRTLPLGLCCLLVIITGILISAKSPDAANLPAFAADQPPAQSKRFHINGEYGLWVERDSTETSVHWLTRKKNPGFLEVRVSDSIWYQFQTPDSLAHAVTFPAPGDTTLRLNYGAATDSADNHYTTLYAPPPLPGDTRIARVDSLYVLGDIHGQYNDLISLLRTHALLDSNDQWRGGSAQLVFLGDIFDRGHDVIKILWLIYRLERQARRSGGGAHLVLGNHEIMVLLNDLRYTSGKEKLIARYHGTDYTGMFNIQRSVLGRWLSNRPAVMQINDILLSHGGISSQLLDVDLKAYNDSLHFYMNEEPFPRLLDKKNPGYVPGSAKYVHRLNFFFGMESPFWYRDYVLKDEPPAGLLLTLRQFQAAFQIVAHTPVRDITSRFDGKLIAVDLQMPATEMLLVVRHRGKPHQLQRLLLDGQRLALREAAGAPAATPEQ